MKILTDRKNLVERHSLQYRSNLVQRDVAGNCYGIYEATGVEPTTYEILDEN